MSNVYTRRNDFLGMNHSTAASKLRKMLLFKYVKLAGHDTCYKCGSKIESIDDFSIEHKKPWLYENPNLFWDLDNIAFSHMRCNRPHRKGVNKDNTNRRKVYKDKLWCNKCKKFLNKDEFSDNKYTWSGKQKWCKNCKSIYYKKKPITKALQTN